MQKTHQTVAHVHENDFIWKQRAILFRESNDGIIALMVAYVTQESFTWLLLLFKPFKKNLALPTDLMISSISLLRSSYIQTAISLQLIDLTLN